MSSVGSRGDSYDNALAESVNGLYKGELIERHKPWRTVEQVELATARWVDWWNRRATPFGLWRRAAGRVRGRLPSVTRHHRGRLKTYVLYLPPKSVRFIADGRELRDTRAACRSRQGCAGELARAAS